MSTNTKSGRSQGGINKLFNLLDNYKTYRIPWVVSLLLSHHSTRTTRVILLPFPQGSPPLHSLCGLFKRTLKIK
jgi:hypothetical protein